jgi:hypothetical protein
MKRLKEKLTADGRICTSVQAVSYVQYSLGDWFLEDEKKTLRLVLREEPQVHLEQYMAKKVPFFMRATLRLVVWYVQNGSNLELPTTLKLHKQKIVSAQEAFQRCLHCLIFGFGFWIWIPQILVCFHLKLSMHRSVQYTTRIVSAYAQVCV